MLLVFFVVVADVVVADVVVVIVVVLEVVFVSISAIVVVNVHNDDVNDLMVRTKKKIK